jgi:Fur family ferric uptake transcriptional regulator
MTSRTEQKCLEKGIRMTHQRRVIAKVLSEAMDHPDVKEVYDRSTAIDRRISLATVYRTVRLYAEMNILDSLELGEGRTRYEESAETHHDHLIDLKSGKIIDFTNAEMEALQNEIAKKLGYRLVDHKFEIFALPLAETEGE